MLSLRTTKANLLLTNPRLGGQLLVGRVLSGVVSKAIHTRTPATFRDLSRTGRLVTGVADVADELLPDAPASELARWRKEFEDDVVPLLDRPSPAGALPWPSEWRAERKTAESLYVLVRGRRPTRIAETGVANGHSSTVMLSALARNEHGQLYSFDVSASVGGLVPERLRDRWTLTRLTDTSGRQLRNVLLGAGPMQLFFHDGDHSFAGQWLDYLAAEECCEPGALLISDDVDESNAFSDFCGERKSRPVLLFDRRKITGYCVLEAARSSSGSRSR